MTKKRLANGLLGLVVSITLLVSVVRSPDAVLTYLLLTTHTPNKT
jgi:hypothetical protein